MDTLSFFWDLKQQTDIEQLKTEVSFTKGDAQAAAQSVLMNIVVPLEKRMDKLSLVTRAMWSLLREKTDVVESDLVRRIADLDAMDGQMDGKVTRPPMDCPNCKSMVSRKFNRCLFCGYVPPEGSPFDSV
ncbi:MAG: hypothetical protein A2107_01875 [Verrucomicrobia bacterium GWF2_62_7]|nr:MAG: hypothetical protein A2107_01875 [Verrucomicrobia bacterium GWF2_62_7]